MFTKMVIFTTVVNIRNTVNLLKVMGILLHESFAFGRVPDWLAAMLRRLPSLDASVEDGTIRIKAGKRRVESFEVWSRARVSTEDTKHLAEAASSMPRRNRWLIATGRLTEEGRSLLQDAGVSWAERETGVCHLRGECLYVYLGQAHLVYDRSVSGRDSYWSGDRPTRLTGKSGILAETLLTGTLSREFALDDVASEAGVSKPLASRVLSRLVDEGLVETRGSGPAKRFVLKDAAALLDLWAAEDSPTTGRHTTGIYTWVRTPLDLYWRLSDLGVSLEYAVGGTAAANLYTPTLTTPPWPEVWIPADVPVEQVAGMLGGEIVEEGANLTMLQHQGDSALYHARSLGLHVGSNAQLADLRVVSRPRAFVEALAGTGRSAEVARNLRGDMRLYDQ